MVDRSDILKTPEAAALLNLPNVQSLGLGLKRVGGRYTQDIAVIVDVDKKLLPDQLPPESRVPPMLGDVPTDVQRMLDPAGFRPDDGGPLTVDRQRVRPLCAGLSIGVSSEHAGTLGFFARRNSDGKPVLVSNYHVLYRGRGTLDVTGEPRRVFQPPIGAENKVSDIAGGEIGGTVDAAYGVLDLEGSTCCSRAPIAHENKTRNTQSSGPSDAVIIKGVARAEVNDVVTKTGRTSGKTTGRVVRVDMRVSSAVDYSDYDLPAGSSFTFNDLIMVVTYDPATGTYDDHTPFATRGDSGSALINDRGELVGLHFLSYETAADARRFGFSAHIAAVEQRLGITVPGTRRSVPAAPPAPVLAQYGGDLETGDFVIADTRFAAGTAQRLGAEIRGRFATGAAGQAWQALFMRHRDEVIRLVNARRGVTLTWQRAHGPAWLAACMRSMTHPEFVPPAQIEGVTPSDLAIAMRAALMRDGSAELQRDLDAHGAQLLAILANVATPDEAVAALNSQAPAGEAVRDG